MLRGKARDHARGHAFDQETLTAISQLESIGRAFRAEIGCEVIEIYGADPAALRDELAPFSERTEISGETLFCYVRDPQPVPLVASKVEAPVCV